MRHISCSLLLAAFCAFHAARADEPARRLHAPESVRISSLDLRLMGQEFGRPGINQTLWDGSKPRLPLTIAGQAFEHGIASHATSYLTLALDGNALQFQAVCGVDDDSAGSVASVCFSVWADGREAWKSPVMKAGDKGVPVNLPLKNVRNLVLFMDDGGDGNRSDHGDWANAMISYAGEPPTITLNRPLVTPDKPSITFGLELYYEKDSDKDFANAEAKRMQDTLKQIAPHVTLDIEVLKATEIIRSRFTVDGTRHDVPNHKPKKPNNQTLLITDEEIGASGWGGPGACVVNRRKIQEELDAGDNPANITLHEWLHTIVRMPVNGRRLDWLHDNPAWGFPDADSNDKTGDGVWHNWYRFYLRWK